MKYYSTCAKLSEFPVLNYRNSEMKPSRRQTRFQTSLVAMAHFWKNHVYIYSKSPKEEKIELQSPARPANILSIMMLLSVSVIDNAPKMCTDSCASKNLPLNLDASPRNSEVH